MASSKKRLAGAKVATSRQAKQEAEVKAKLAAEQQAKREKVIIIVALAIAAIAIIVLCVTLALNHSSKVGTVIEGYSIEEDAGEAVQALNQEYEDGELAQSELMSTYYTLYNTGEITLDELYTLADLLGEEVDKDLIK